jgi:pimeloyl-ACP methyl ester carboxylesterase
MASFTNRTLTANGIRLAVRDEGRGPAVVLCHGFPELAYSWRHQVPALAAAGFRVIAPDQRGYGGSDRPADAAAYDIHHLTCDLVGILDALGIERAVFVGHDWGGLVTWMMPLLHRARVAGVIGVNTPYLPRSPMPPIPMIRQLFGDNHYMVHLQQPGVADRALAADVRRVFTQLMRRATEPVDRIATGVLNLVEIVALEDLPGEPFLTEEELAVYVDNFERTGFTSAINWYRNLDHNWETTPQLAGARIDLPSLMVTAEWDAVLRPEMAELMKGFTDDLETVMIPRCGHWTQQEQPDALSRIMIDWLQRRFGARAS